jgi:tRNA(Ile)-lysidine synthase
MARTGGLTAPELDAFVATVVPRLPDPPVVVALSGGADSAALAFAVVSRGGPARAVTVHHHLPGSAAMVQAAARIAERLGLPHQVIDVSGGESETELRERRLTAIESIMGDGETVVTGHTRDDQAETVLGNLLRGTGLSGLAGIPSRRGAWVRPMLDIPRATAREVATLAGLAFADDPQNDDPAIRRNRLRAETIPALASAFNPELLAALARTGRLAGADDALLGRRADAVPLRWEEGAVLIPVASLIALPQPIASRVVRRALRLMLEPYPGTFADVAAVLGAVAGPAASLSGGLIAARERPYVALHRGDRPEPLEPVELSVPGAARFGGWKIESGRVGLGRNGAMIAADGPLMVRAVRPGDRISIRGGSKKVSDALAEAGVPLRLRPRWPVVESGGRIAWLVSIRASDERKGEVGMAATRFSE